jgi:2-polyprenyl-6-hydroxyphenyl methylase/3-demethylubiquinone-9 3-methyltransferase
MRFKYYDRHLAADRLMQAYEIAPPRVRQYLHAEVDHVLGRIATGHTVLELGCGYGRILASLADKAALVVGIDTSLPSLMLASSGLTGASNCVLACMDASDLALGDARFDCVVCIQNGISAFHVDRRLLLEESLRVTKAGGTVLFSTYSMKFWDARLDWFRRQAGAGLLGKIDSDRTRNGTIVCEDGFTATTVCPEEFIGLTEGLDVKARIVEVDESSVFLEMVKA